MDSSITIINSKFTALLLVTQTWRRGKGKGMGQTSLSLPVGGPVVLPDDPNEDTDGPVPLSSVTTLGETVQIESPFDSFVGC